MKSSHLLRLSALITLLAFLPAARAATPDFATPPGKPGSPQYNQWLGRALTRLQRLDDEDALRQLAYAYGRGNDEITIHHGDRPKGRALAIAEYSRSFAPEARIEVFALGGAAPIANTVGVPAWAEFVEKYYEGNRYSSTIHLMSNSASSSPMPTPRS